MAKNLNYQVSFATLKVFSQLEPYNETTKYSSSSTKEFMINYRVANLEALDIVLKKEGVTLCDTNETVK